MFYILGLTERALSTDAKIGTNNPLFSLLYFLALMQEAVRTVFVEQSHSDLEIDHHGIQRSISSSCHLLHVLIGIEYSFSA
jgi:hypothetical protein